MGQYDSLVSVIRIANNLSSVCDRNINSHDNIVNSVNIMRAETRSGRCVFKIVGIVSRVNTVGVSKMR